MSTRINFDSLLLQTQANVEVVTGWVLGTGPCGQGCSKANIGQSTNQRRQTMETSLAKTELFGKHTLAFNISTTPKDLRPQFVNNFTETVIAVSESAKYEQELLRFSFLLIPPADNTQEFE